MKDLTVEILLASYNGEAYIRDQIDSILHQTDERWHLTVSDDGSSDRTPEILDEYVNQYPNKITRVYSGRRFGNARDHFFWLIEQCKAEYAATCDQDDHWYCDKVKKQIDALLAAEEQYSREMPLLVFSDQTPTDAQLNPLASSFMRYQNQFFDYFDYRSILMQNVVTGGAMAFNRALAELAMQCVDPQRTIMHDWWMAAVAARFGKIVYIDEPLSDYRQHGTNSVGAKDVRSAAHVFNKLSHIEAIRKTTRDKKRQACAFADTYALCLGKEDEAFLAPFVKDKSGPLFYWKHRELIHGFFRLAGM
ncbi:MAG: glycosyltransferase family 2 protein, partial [Clostridia bacterium]|nr:glycosyltransferase family 2 protein [Clostridia bacterium]